jgi:hypothetical protein
MEYCVCLVKAINYILKKRTRFLLCQFAKLAGALKETNQNLLTFEFMLAQYRRLARIEPFNAEKDLVAILWNQFRPKFTDRTKR